MMTFGVCLIYYGIALLLYQINGWLTEGHWTPFPVMRAWEAAFGAPTVESPAMRGIVLWLLDWPLSLSLLLSGATLVGLVFAARRLRAARGRRLRRRWISEQCARLGYPPWNLPKVLNELDEEILAERARREEAG